MLSVSVSASYIALWALALLQGLVTLAVLQQLAKLNQLVAQGVLPGDNRLSAGSDAPDFQGIDHRSGAHVWLRDLSTGGVLLFLAPDCSICRRLVASMGQRTMEELPSIIVFCRGDERACADFMKRLSVNVRLVLAGTEEIAARYRISGFPTAVVLDDNLRVQAYSHPKHADDVIHLWRSVLGEQSIETEPTFT